MEAIQKEVAREVARLLEVIFQDRRKSGHLDLEAIEMAMRSAMHQAGAAALSKLLQWDAPAGEQRSIACRPGMEIAGACAVGSASIHSAARSLREYRQLPCHRHGVGTHY